jgi:hypothetical protein
VKQTQDPTVFHHLPHELHQDFLVYMVKETLDVQIHPIDVSLPAGSTLSSLSRSSKGWTAPSLKKTGLQVAHQLIQPFQILRGSNWPDAVH